MKTQYSRVTISLPAPLLDAVDAQLTRPEETRSAVIRRLIEQALREGRERADVEQWVRSYREQPPTEEDGIAAARFPDELAKELPWE